MCCVCFLGVFCAFLSYRSKLAITHTEGFSFGLKSKICAIFSCRCKQILKWIQLNIYSPHILLVASLIPQSSSHNSQKVHYCIINISKSRKETKSSHSPTAPTMSDVHNKRVISPGVNTFFVVLEVGRDFKTEGHGVEPGHSINHGLSALL